ncbi:hypothetical protein IFM89_018086 [Coptis chinensis]|uniref:Pentatricopeptide repeat-containing protein n=1 Tax=Coptis chinensis TaxID=261450 RepID=A0A835LZR8_9MAGN|nr:hypothetical protein IFM89_018086 [Coptis chinensis]
MWEVLVEMRKKDKSLITTRTLQVVLARVAKVCSVRKTVESFRRFRKMVLVYDTSCYNGLLRTLCQEKSMSDARNVYHCLKKDFKPNLQTFNILLCGWKSSEEAEGFFEEMLELGVKPDAVSYNCLVDVYCKNREIDKALKPDKARDVLKEMMEYGCYPDAAAYNAVIRNFCIAKRVMDAYNLMDEMLEEAENCFLQMAEKGHKPSNVSFRRIKLKDLDEQLILSCCPLFLLQGSTAGVKFSKRLYVWQQAPASKMCNIYVVYDRTKGTKKKEEEQNLSKTFLTVVMDNASEFLGDGRCCFMSQSVPGNKILPVEVGCCV